MIFYQDALIYFKYWFYHECTRALWIRLISITFEEIVFKVFENPVLLIWHQMSWLRVDFVRKLYVC